MSEPLWPLEDLDKRIRAFVAAVVDVDADTIRPNALLRRDYGATLELFEALEGEIGFELPTDKSDFSLKQITDYAREFLEYHLDND